MKSPEPKAKQARPFWRRCLSVAILAIVLVALWYVVDLGKVWETIQRIHPLALGLALLLATLDRFAMGFKWRQLIVAGGGSVRLTDIVSAYYQAALSGRFMPITVGQDLFRGFLIQRRGVPAGLVMSSMGVEKLIAVLANVGLALAGTLYLASQMAPNTRAALITAAIIALAATAAAVVIAFSRSAHGVFERLTRNRIPARFAKVLRRFSESMLYFGSQPGILLRNLALAMGEQGIILVKFFVLGSALGVSLPLFTFFAVIATVMFARRVTAYFEGWGLTEAASVVLFALLGFTQEQAVALAVVNYGVSTIALLPGVYLLYRGRFGLAQIRQLDSAPAAAADAKVS
jgi:glycosyltransferase 2 family protein